MNEWYLTIRNDNTVADPFVADRVSPADFDIWPVVSGHLLDPRKFPLTLQASNGEWDGEPDDVLQNALGIPIYSERLQMELTKEGFTDIQYLPVQVLRPDMSEIAGFAIANVLGLVPCLDWEKSKYRRHRRFPSKCSSVSKAVLIRSAIEGLELFRIKEFPLYLIASRRFKEVFEHDHFTGYSFAQVQVE